MLILTRRTDECVLINPGAPDEVVVTVVAVRPDGRVKLGFAAPRRVVIHRSEIAALIARNQSTGGDTP